MKDKNLIISVVALILAIASVIVVYTSPKQIVANESDVYGGTTNLDSIDLNGNLTVDGTTTLTGAVTQSGAATLASTLGVTGALTADDDLIVGTTDFFVDDSAGQVSVGTTTNLGADLTVYSGTAAASSTVMVGTSAHGSSARGFMCQWNGTNFTYMYFLDNSVTPAYATSTSCP